MAERRESRGWIERQPLLRRGFGAGEIAAVKSRLREIEIRASETRIRPDCRFELRGGPDRFATRLVNQAEVEMRSGVVGVFLERLAQVELRLVVPFQLDLTFGQLLEIERSIDRVAHGAFQY